MKRALFIFSEAAVLDSTLGARDLVKCVAQGMLWDGADQLQFGFPRSVLRRGLGVLKDARKHLGLRCVGRIAWASGDDTVLVMEKA